MINELISIIFIVCMLGGVWVYLNYRPMFNVDDVVLVILFAVAIYTIIIFLVDVFTDGGLL